MNFLEGCYARTNAKFTVDCLSFSARLVRSEHYCRLFWPPQIRKCIKEGVIFSVIVAATAAYCIWSCKKRLPRHNARGYFNNNNNNFYSS